MHAMCPPGLPFCLSAHCRCQLLLPLCWRHLCAPSPCCTQVVSGLRDGDFVRVKMCHLETLQPKVRGRHRGARSKQLGLCAENPFAGMPFLQFHTCHPAPNALPLSLSSAPLHTGKNSSILLSFSTFTSSLVLLVSSGADPQDGYTILADLEPGAGPFHMHLEQGEHHWARGPLSMT